MDKRKIIVSVFLAYNFIVLGQSFNIQTANNALKHGELDKAKSTIDLAAQNDDTKNDKKMWYYRGKVYLAINDSSRKEKYKNIDQDAAEKAVISFTNCLKADKDNIYKEEVTPLLVQSSIRLYNRAKDAYYVEKNYEKAVRYYNALFDVFPLDKDKALERSNIFAETINYELFRISRSSGNNAKAKEYIQKLIDIKYKDPNIYMDMSGILLSERDTTNALKYIEMGRNLFDDNQKLINAELGIYIAQKKMDVLLEKTSKAIEAAPDNEMLYYIRGKLYKDKNQFDKAVADFAKAIDIKPDYFDPNYELGESYFNRGADWNKKSNDLPPSQSQKAKEYEDKMDADFKKAIPYLEKAMQLNEKDKNVLIALKQLYARTGDNEKLQQINEKLKTK
jgi:tetratricopeptide (TPR) repeat protein